MAYQHTMDSIEATTSAASSDPTANEQKAREAGRKTQINTVRNLLGIPIDHFIEVTLVAFFQIAQVVQPITVCLNQDTRDNFSGADFHKGVQQIDASQAMAFVRQRRDINSELMFTDLDRTRRQQAFIVSLLSAIRHGGSLSSPSDLRDLLEVARQNIAVDSGFDLASFVQHAASFTDRGLSLYTLPIIGFSQDSVGEDINTVDVPAIRSIVHHLVNGEAPTGPPTSTTGATSAVGNAAMTATGGIVLNVVNASEVAGLAAQTLATFSERGFTAGEASSTGQIADESTITYGPGAQTAAEELASQLNLTATASAAVARDTVQLTIGADFPGTGYLTSSAASTSSSTTSPTTPVATVSATATGTQAPAPTDLTRMTTDRAPCVK
jgi:LCP family protein required for cell wall assembly